MKPKAYIGAILAAAVGAGLWAAVSHFLSLEIGWLAWGIGAMVGGVAFALGGRGPVSGGTAAILTIAAMLGGKSIALDAGIEKGLAERIIPDDHRELMTDADAYPGSEDREALRKFIVDHSFGDTGSDEEIEEFLEVWEPSLVLWKTEKPSYESWRDGRPSSTRRSAGSSCSRTPSASTTCSSSPSA